MDIKMLIIIGCDHDDEIYYHHNHKDLTIFPFFVYKTQT